MSTFSKALHIGEETVTVVGNDGAVSLGMSRQSVRLSHEEADELVEALMHGRTRSDGFTAADMADARAQGFRDGQKAIRDIDRDDIYAAMREWFSPVYRTSNDAMRAALESFRERVLGEGA